MKMRITEAFDRCQLEGTEAISPCLHSKQSPLGVLGTSEKSREMLRWPGLLSGLSSHRELHTT
ncbi:rCG42405 [Rattus norvegicus]|uniref:RCG42405 n=1 Tax=Rattus norvegicus TaxID=10116 RepID=A6KSB2_RAT|nr:rCG42405 [Rattus norvegicus]